MHPSMEDHSLSLPLLTTPASASASASSSAASTARDDHHGMEFSSSSSSAIVFRLLLVILVGTISVWANHEAAKGFEVTIINSANKKSPAGKRFALFYISNDEATRIILNTSSFVENILYHHHPQSNQTKKQIHHVILQLASKNLTSEVIVEASKSREFDYVISLSPSILEQSNHKYAVRSAIQRAMARIWLRDGKSRAPTWLIDGMVEYLWIQAGFGEGKSSFGSHEKETLQNPGSKLLGSEQICHVISQICSKSNNTISSRKAESGPSLSWEDKDPKIVAKALNYLEQQNKGYIQGLNQVILRDGWENNQPCKQSNEWMLS